MLTELMPTLQHLSWIFQNTPTFSLSDGFQRSYGYFFEITLFFGPPCTRIIILAVKFQNWKWVWVKRDLSLLEYSFVKLLLFNFRFGREITRTLEEILKWNHHLSHHQGRKDMLYCIDSMCCVYYWCWPALCRACPGCTAPWSPRAPAQGRAPPWPPGIVQ